MQSLEPIRLNGLTIDFPVALGPMAGVTDLPFRLLCREMGCGVFYTEMISAKALHYRNKNTAALMATDVGEHPLAIQLFGSDPDIIAEEALKIEDRCDFINLNFGCPVPKIVKNGEGSFLLSQPETAEKIFKKLTKTVHKPVSVKMRLSYSGDPEEGLKTAKIAAESGISMLEVHGRTRDQFYSGKADREGIRKIVRAVDIPVLANGDISSAADAEEMLAETGAAGLMVGRASMGNPWIFKELRSYFETGETYEKPALPEIVGMALRHARMLTEFKGERIAVMEMRKHAAWYLQGQKDTAKIRRAINEVASYSELEGLLLKLIDKAGNL